MKKETIAEDKEKMGKAIEMACDEQLEEQRELKEFIKNYIQNYNRFRKRQKETDIAFEKFKADIDFNLLEKLLLKESLEK